VVRYVSVVGSNRTHAQLVVDAARGRTVCGLPVGGEASEPASSERCRACWADWRVRGEQPRFVGPRFGSPSIER
jgi:hypothetical protein